MISQGLKELKVQARQRPFLNSSIVLHEEKENGAVTPKQDHYSNINLSQS